MIKSIFLALLTMNQAFAATVNDASMFQTPQYPVAVKNLVSNVSFATDKMPEITCTQKEIKHFNFIKELSQIRLIKVLNEIKKMDASSTFLRLAQEISTKEKVKFSMDNIHDKHLIFAQYLKLLNASLKSVTIGLLQPIAYVCEKSLTSSCEKDGISGYVNGEVNRITKKHKWEGPLYICRDFFDEENKKEFQMMTLIHEISHISTQSYDHFGNWTHEFKTNPELAIKQATEDAYHIEDFAINSTDEMLKRIIRNIYQPTARQN